MGLGWQFFTTLGGVRRGKPAARYRRCTSLGQNSKTSSRVYCGSNGAQAALPVRVSISTGRCKLDTRIGETPGMYQVLRVDGHQRLGNSPEAAQTSMRISPGGGLSGLICTLGKARGRASAMRKNSGAAVLAPMNAGFGRPSKLPTHTTST